MNNNDVKTYFESLSLSDWAAKGNIKDGKQAIGIDVQNLITKEYGFFRALRREEDVDKERFRREVKILTDPSYRHRNIINIIEHSNCEDDFWYISEKKNQFKDRWKIIQDRCGSDYDQLFGEALNVLLKLADGLVSLHRNKVVHRDIKPDNIVADDEGEPILIDFGIVFEPEEERITPEDSATGNARFSPDQMINRLEEVPPWIDIFHLGQLLIWMVAEKSAKNHWNRPLHWMYVRYPAGLSDRNSKILRAITAVTSNMATSPKDASELINLIESLKGKELESYDMNELSKKLIGLLSDKELSEQENKVLSAETIANNYHLMTSFEDKINTAVIDAIKNLDDSLVNIKLNKRFIEYQTDIVLNENINFNPHSPYEYSVLDVDFGYKGQTAFTLHISIKMQIPSKRELYSERIPEEYSNFFLRLEITSTHPLFEKKGFTKYHHVYFKPNGEIFVYLNTYTGDNTIDGFIRFVIERIKDEDAWNL